MKQNIEMYVRSVIFGINDSLVSTVGFLAGISVAGVPQTTVVLTGLIYALVEAFSMAAGSYLSEESGREYRFGVQRTNKPEFFAAVLMFFASIGGAIIPLAPYLVVAGSQALLVSVTFSILGLFLLGAATARFSRLPAFARGMRMVFVGGMAILLGVLVGSFAPPL